MTKANQIRIVLEGLRGQEKWPDPGYPRRDATKDEVKRAREENEGLKRALVEYNRRERHSRMSTVQKLEILRAVESSELSVAETLRRLDVPLATYYRWRSIGKIHLGVQRLSDLEAKRPCARARCDANKSNIRSRRSSSLSFGSSN